MSMTLPLDPIIFIAGPPILAAGATLWHVARRVRDNRARLRADAWAALDTAAPGEIVEVRPHLWVVGEPRCQVIDARARFAARRAVAGGPMGGSAA